MSAQARLTVQQGDQSDPLEGWSLPAWTYDDPDFFATEAEHVFRPSWQLVCHESDIARPGDMVVCLGAGSISGWANLLPSQLDALAKGQPMPTEPAE